MSTNHARIGFAPVVYEHASSFIGKSPYQVSRDADLLFQAHAAAYEWYRQSPIAVGIDVYNVEIEAYGSRIADPLCNEVPSAAEPILDSAAEIPALPDWDAETGSRFGLAFSAAKALKAKYPSAEVRIPLSGPFSIASGLMGFDNLLCECLTDPDSVRAALEFLARKQVSVVRAAAEKGYETILFESAAAPPLLSPEMFKDLVVPALKIYCDGYRLIEFPERENPRAPTLIIGGDVAAVADYLISLSPGFLICPAETDQTAFMERLKGHPEIGIRINMKASLVAAKEETDAQNEAARVADVARRTAIPGRPLMVGTGVLPVNADPERIRRLGEFVSRL